MIRCVSPYRSSLGHFAPGETVTDAALAQALCVDSPGSFEPVAVEPEAPPAVDPVETKAISEPLEHRAIKGSTTKRKG